jgi:hypothetical protein
MIRESSRLDASCRTPNAGTYLNDKRQWKLSEDNQADVKRELSLLGVQAELAKW